jgi:antirestriction protein ArdC
MATATKIKFTKKRVIKKNDTAKKNPFLEMIVEGLEKVEQKNWEHYLKYQIDFTPKNLFTKLPYNRFNRFTLMLDMMINNLNSPYYATFNQISAGGGMLRKGSKGIVLQYFSYSAKNKETFKSVSLDFYKSLTVEQQKNYIVSSFIKFFRVFNINCIENINELKIDINNIDEDLKNCTDVNLSEKAEDFILKLKNEKGLILNHEKQNQAFYTPSKDTVTMPFLEMFKDDVKYYSTLFHELIHWTGSAARLNRFSEDNKPNSKEIYAFEELVAEMGSMLVYFDYDFKGEFVNSLVYLKGWLKHTASDENKINILENAFKESNKAVSFLYN